MSLPSFSVRKPITTLMLFTALTLFGLVAFSRLPVELMPNASYDKITILVDIRGGMPPVDVEFLVTRPIEEALSSVTHLESIASTSKEGKSTVVLSFPPGSDMDFASLEVREKFAKVKNKLPREAEKPVIAKYEESDAPIMILAIASFIQSTEEIRTLVEDQIKERLMRIHGVANIEVGGGRERKILAEIDQKRIQALKLPMEKVLASISKNNLNLMVGSVDKNRYKILLRTMGQLPSIEAIKEIPILKTDQFSLVRLKDIAEVKDSFLEATTYSRTNSQEVVSLYIQKESTANTVKVCEQLQSEIDDIVKGLGKDIRVITVSNQAIFIQQAINTVLKSLRDGGILAIIVLFIFLRDLRSTFSIALSMPISIVVTFAMMYFSGLTVNVQTLSGLALGIGMLTDNAIVVLENIDIKRARGIHPIDAAIEGSQQMLLALVSSTATTVIVFLPIVFINKQIQLLYQGLALTVTYSLVASLFTALSVVPLMASRGTQNLKKRVAGGFLRKIRRLYRKSLFYAVRYRYLSIGIIFFTLYLAFTYIGSLDKELLASSEEGKFTIFVELPSGAKLEVSDIVVKQVEEIVSKIPEVQTVSSRVEGWSSKVYVELVPGDKREKSVEEIIEELRPQFKDLGEAQRAFIYFSESRGGGSKEVLVDVYGFDYATLKKLATEIAGKMEKVKGLTDLKLRMKEGRPEMQIVIDKYKAALHGLSTYDIGEELHAQIRGKEATRFHSKGKEIETIARLQQKDRAHLSDIRKLTLVTPKGELIELKDVCQFKEDIGPSEVWRMNKTRMIQVSANLHNLSMEKAAAMIRDSLKDMSFPKDYYYLFGGDYARQIENQKQLLLALCITMVLIYMLLASLFESYFQPFIIMSAIPLCAIGVAIALGMTHTTISMGVMIGAIMLGGIVVNHSIVMVDHINYVRKFHGYGPFRSVVSSGIDRLRPIMMTAATTTLGLFPTAMDKSQGASLWSPLAITVIGGIISSTIMTLYIVPSLYIIFRDMGKVFQKMFKSLKVQKFKSERPFEPLNP
ncbi:MAG: efflux RND transporter permease subunit [Chlamydiae bacterium]|nr:efflux RND transporter permease subunit [Chlamydiota bacterium]MBI3266984.1 efflux RND transporter permease subunit [Chlamydiota bacterium]